METSTFKDIFNRSQSAAHITSMPYLGLVSSECLHSGDFAHLQLLDQLAQRYFDNQLTLHRHQLTAVSQLFGEQFPSVTLQVQPAPHALIVFSLG